MAKLRKDNNSTGWNGRKRSTCYSPRRRNVDMRTSYHGTSASTEREAGRKERTAPLTVNTTGSRRSVEYKPPPQKNYNKYSEYTPLAAPLKHVFEVGDKARMFRKPTRIGPPGRRDLGKYCAFHDANGHETALSSLEGSC